MTYAGDRIVHDADAHIMETPDWLDPWLDPGLADRVVRPPMVGGVGGTGGSRSLVVGGSALSKASDAVIEKAMKVAAARGVVAGTEWPVARRTAAASLRCWPG